MSAIQQLVQYYPSFIDIYVPWLLPESLYRKILIKTGHRVHLTLSSSRSYFNLRFLSRNAFLLMLPLLLLLLLLFNNHMTFLNIINRKWANCMNQIENIKISVILLIPSSHCFQYA